MECDAAGANIYHIIACEKTFNFLLRLLFYFQLYIYYGVMRARAITVDQVCAKIMLTLNFYRD